MPEQKRKKTHPISEEEADEILESYFADAVTSEDKDEIEVAVATEIQMRIINSDHSDELAELWTRICTAQVKHEPPDPTDTKRHQEILEQLELESRAAVAARIREGRSPHGGPLPRPN